MKTLINNFKKYDKYLIPGIIINLQHKDWNGQNLQNLKILSRKCYYVTISLWLTMVDIADIFTYLHNIYFNLWLTMVDVEHGWHWSMLLQHCHIIIITLSQCNVYNISILYLFFEYRFNLIDENFY